MECYKGFSSGCSSEFDRFNENPVLSIVSNNDPLAQGAALIFHVENFSVPKMLLFLWPTLKQTYKTPSGGMWNDTKEQAEKST